MVITDLNALPPCWEDERGNFVAVDNGYAHQKIAYWANVKGKRKLVCFKLPSIIQAGRVNIDLDGTNTGVYEIEGTHYTVNPRANNPESTQIPGYAFSEINNVLVNHSLIAAGFGGKDVRLVTGLPFNDVYRNGEKNQVLIDKVIDSMKTPTSPMTGEPTARIIEHNVFAESTAAYIDFAYNEKTADTETYEDDVVIIDMGGNTTDIATINGGGIPSINIEKSSTKQIGVLFIKKELAPLLMAKYNIEEPRPHELERAITENQFKLFGKSENVSELTHQAKLVTIKKVINYVGETIGSGASMGHIFFAGGGAQVAGNEFLASYPHATISDNPEFANARGLLIYHSEIKNAA